MQGRGKLKGNFEVRGGRDGEDGKRSRWIGGEEEKRMWKVEFTTLGEMWWKEEIGQGEAGVEKEKKEGSHRMGLVEGELVVSGRALKEMAPV